MTHTYAAHATLRAIDHHVVWVMAFLTICLVSTFVYLISAFVTSERHRAYPAPFAAVGFFAIHDASFVANWHTWFHTYHHWWVEGWAIALISTSAIEFALCFQVYRYGREELFPSLSQREFGLVLIGGLLGITGMWVVVRGALDDPLWLISFAVTAWMPPVWSTILLMGRRSMRGQTRLMNWCLLTNPIGMFGAWAFMGPYFRTTPWLFLWIATIGWAAFNVWLVHARFEPYAPPGTTGAGIAAGGDPRRQPSPSVA